LCFSSLFPVRSVSFSWWIPNWSPANCPTNGTRKTNCFYPNVPEHGLASSPKFDDHNCPIFCLWKMQYIAILRYNEVWWGIMRSHNCVLQYIEVYWPNFQTPICLICLDHTHFGESTETAVALSTKVVVGDAKTALVAVRPLKVVNEGPGSITCQAGNVWVIIYKFANI
jgi:hypothetical protein